MKFRLFGVLMVLLLLFVAVAAVAAHGNGNSPGHLGEAGWMCEPVEGLGVHCFPPGTEFGSPSITVKVFDTDDPTAVHDADFLGTELLLRADIYDNGKPPCPQDHGEYSLLPFGYYACHHYETDHS